MADSPRRALITGISGQDGSYLTAHLQAAGASVWGFSRSGRGLAGTTVHALDICDYAGVKDFVSRIRPTECYHLAALHRSSSAAESDKFAHEDDVFRVNFDATRNLMNTLRDECPGCRLFLAGSCQMFGRPVVSPQDEHTPFCPNNTYSLAKVLSCELGHFYSRRGDLYCSTGILFNHESPLRGAGFVTSRIARAAVEISRGASHRLRIGNLSARVDWGFAGDYVQAMTAALSIAEPTDFVIATGLTNTVQKFAEIAFRRVNLDWTRYVTEDPSVYASGSATAYCGNPTKAHSLLRWKPSVSFDEMVNLMVDQYDRSTRSSNLK